MSGNILPGPQGGLTPLLFLHKNGGRNVNKNLPLFLSLLIKNYVPLD
jgi:hypothetical protein